MITIAVANQKGGVGKTTSAVNLATAMAAMGWRTLLVDLDPQGNASTGLGVNAEDRGNSSYELLVDGISIEECVVATAIPNLDLIPAKVDLSGAEIEMVEMHDRTGLLGAGLAGANYDICFIDCPPSLGLLTLNALTAASRLLVPLQCEFYALEGLSQLLRTVEQVRERFNPEMEIVGIALTMFDRRNRLTDQVSDDVRGVLGKLVFDAVVPRNVRLSEAPSHGLPAIVYDHNCSGSRAYMDLARELIERLPERRKAA